VQVGTTAGKAALWIGSPDSYVDLDAFAPPEFTSTFAEDVEVSPDGHITVIGYGYNSSSEQFEALLWEGGSIMGDLDGDGDVDLADLAQLLAHYGTTSGAVYEDGDMDGDGDVDLADLAALLAVYGTVSP
jgi:hypothetical protein